MNATQVMIVEDEAIVGIDIQDSLLNYGYKVLGIENSGETALERVAKTRPEIILMDIQLKGKMNGIETAKIIKKKFGIPIIYLSAYSDDKTLSKAIETSPAGYLLKPFVPKELHTTIQTAIQKNISEKKLKLDRLRYIQKNILKQKALKQQLEEFQTKEKKESKTIEHLIGNLIFRQTVSKDMPYIIPLKEFAPILEYSREEITKMGTLIIPLLVHPEDFPIIESYYKKILTDSNRVSEVEFRLKHKSGIWRWFNSRGILEKTNDNEKTIIHSTQDITWLKNLQYTSHIAREKLIAISNNPYFGIAVIDTDAKIMNINPTLEHLTGYTKDDLNWLNCSDYIGIKELRNICLNFEKLRTGSINTFQAEAFIYTKNNGAFWGYLVFNAIYNTEQSIDRIVCTLVDISESKLFEKKTNSTK